MSPIMADEGMHHEPSRLGVTPDRDGVGWKGSLGAAVSGIEPGEIVAAMPIGSAYAKFVGGPQRALV